MNEVIPSKEDQGTRLGVVDLPDPPRRPSRPKMPGRGPTPPPPHPASDARPAATASGGGAALVMQARALRHERFAPAATDVLSSLALLTHSERASLGLLHGGRMQVAATSTSGQPDAGQSLTALLAAAMQEAVDQAGPIAYPAQPDDLPTLCAAHAELHRANGSLTILTVPILGGDRVIGALLLERCEPFDARASQRVKDTALFVGPLLELKHRVEAPFGGRLIEAVAPRGVRIGSHQVPAWRLIMGAAALALLIAAVWPVTFRVVAPARVEGIDQRTIAAPADGFLATAAVRPGDAVRAGQLLGTLDDREPLLRRDKFAAEAAQIEKKYREALSGEDAGEIIKSRAALESARAQHALAESELERTRLRAPFDGVLIQGDLGAALGSPVSRGQPLLTVAPAHGVKVVVEVADQDITVLRHGQQAQVLFAGLGQAPLPFTVQRISPVATTNDQRNVFEVEGRVDAQPSGASSPGLRGVARIDVDRRMQVQVWWVRVGHWLRRTLWQFMG
jgi:RND family efflux transporter MFP subunit